MPLYVEAEGSLEHFEDLITHYLENGLGDQEHLQFLLTEYAPHLAVRECNKG